MTEGMKEDATNWWNFITSLIARGWRGVHLLTSETTTCLLESYPVEHRRRIRTNTMIRAAEPRDTQENPSGRQLPRRRERLDTHHRQIRYVTANDWSTRRHLDMS